jgi:hypothetical protein
MQARVAPRLSIKHLQEKAWVDRLQVGGDLRPGLGALVGRKTIGLRTGYRRQGMAVAGRCERCRYRADIVDIVEGAAYLTAW